MTITVFGKENGTINSSLGTGVCRHCSYFELHLRDRGKQSCCILGEGLADRAPRLIVYGSYPSYRAFLSLGLDRSRSLWLVM